MPATVEELEQAVEELENTPEPEQQEAPEQQEEFGEGLDVQQEEQQEQEAVQRPKFLQDLEELGFKDVETEEDAQARVIELIRQRDKELEEQRRWRQQNEMFVSYGQQALTQQQHQKTEDKQETPKPWQAPTQLPENYQEYITKRTDDATGQEVNDWRSDTPAALRAQTEEYAQWRNQMVNAMIERPERFWNELLPQFVQDQVRQIAEPLYEQRTEQQREEAFLNQKWEENEWLWRKDVITNEPVVGDPSPEGQKFFAVADELAEAGLTDKRRLWDAAMAMAGPQRQNGTNGNGSADRKQEVLDRNRGAGSIQSRRGSFADEGENRKQNKHLTPGHALLDEMRREGVDI